MSIKRYECVGLPRHVKCAKDLLYVGLDTCNRWSKWTPVTDGPSLWHRAQYPLTMLPVSHGQVSLESKRTSKATGWLCQLGMLRAGAGWDTRGRDTTHHSTHTDAAAGTYTSAT